MGDHHSSEIARASFDAMRRHPPRWWDETDVTEYNNILTALQAAEPDKDFASFQVLPGELDRQVTGWDRYGRKSYSSKLYCDPSRMTRRLEGVAAYLVAVNPPPAAPPLIPPSESSAPEIARPSPAKRAVSAAVRFIWSQAQAIAPALVNAWLKRKGLE